MQHTHTYTYTTNTHIYINLYLINKVGGIAFCILELTEGDPILGHFSLGRFIFIRFEQGEERTTTAAGDCGCIRVSVREMGEVEVYRARTFSFYLHMRGENERGTHGRKISAAATRQGGGMLYLSVSPSLLFDIPKYLPCCCSCLLAKGAEREEEEITEEEEEEERGLADKGKKAVVTEREIAATKATANPLLLLL